ncbi:MAG: UvrD-helicase domain-containing protein [Bryobacteraceae bacterium]
MNPHPPSLQPGDQEARRRIRESLDESLIVEAAAGTGKTTVLVERIAAVLASGRATIERIVAVTFTRKAAGELKLRLRQELDERRRRSSGRERDHLEQALERLEEARIGTIHAFCAEILRARPVEALIDPKFEELNETQAPRLFHKVFDRWIQDKLDQESPVLRRALTRLAIVETWLETPPLRTLEAAAWKIVCWRDFPRPWRRTDTDYRTLIDQLVVLIGRLEGISRHPTRPNDDLRVGLRPLVSFLTWIRRAEAYSPRDYDVLEAMLLKMLAELKRYRRTGRGAYSEEVTREQIVEARGLLIQRLEQLKEETGADTAALLHDEFRELVDRYQDARRRSGGLDFLDLLACTRDLVRDNAEVRRFLQQEQISHLFVDEFQDTDPLQAEILLLLAAEDPSVSDWRAAVPAPGKLFLVGDPKQSIYRFRRADVLFYQEVTRVLHGHGVPVIFLSSSFRAVRPIQLALNHAFSALMTGDETTGQPGYVALGEARPARDDQPPIVVLPVPEPFGKMGVQNAAIDESLPEAVAAFIDWLLRSSGWTVADPENGGALVPVSARHVCVLFRRFLNYGDDLTRAYARKLEARGITHLLVGAKSFHQREEVETLRGALAAIEWPEDELSVYATLRGSLFAIPDALLFRFREAVHHWHPFRHRPDPLDPAFSPIVEALDLLAGLHRRRNHHPIVSTLSTLLEATRAHAGFAWRPGGNQILTNVYRVLDLARNYEADGGISFRGFVEELNARAETTDSSEAPMIEEGAEGVRIMTVHSAKGLEFPIVILADITANIAARQADRFADPGKGLCAQRLMPFTPWEVLDHAALEHARDAAEGLRVAYVASTRARDLLVIPAIGDEPYDGWLAPLNSAIYPDRILRRAAQSAPSCPGFGGDSVFNRTRGHAEDSVKPGLHRMPAGYDIVWWDPAALDLKKDERFGLIHESLLEDAGETGEERRYEEWKSAAREAAGRGAIPAFDVFTATDAIPLPVEAAVRIASVERDAGRPSGVRFGVLVHAALRDVAFGTPAPEIRRAVESRARMHGAPQEEVDAAVTAVGRALGHTLLGRAAAASRVLREAPVLLKLDERRVFEGVLDLAFFEEGRWIVVDYKTDEGRLPDHYQQQLGWYVYAVGRMTGVPAEGWLLHV